MEISVVCEVKIPCEIILYSWCFLTRDLDFPPFFKSEDNITILYVCNLMLSCGFMHNDFFSDENLLYFLLICASYIYFGCSWEPPYWLFQPLYYILRKIIYTHTIPTFLFKKCKTFIKFIQWARPLYVWKSGVCRGIHWCPYFCSKQ